MLRYKKPLSLQKPALNLVRSFRATAWRKNDSTAPSFNSAAVERAEDEVDVCIVDGGPAGLSAAILSSSPNQSVHALYQHQEYGHEIRVVMLEKGSEIGSHIVSGAVIEPRALDELLPDWTFISDHPLTQPQPRECSSSHRNYPCPFPILHKCVAESEYGVEIYAGFAGAQLLLSDEPDSTVRSVQGVITNEVGLTKNYRMKSSFEPGMAFRAKVTLLAEGAHGSLSKQAISLYNLRKEAEPQTYGIGLKEVWRVDPEKHKPGEVVHTLGWPLDKNTYGGGWVYHMDGGLVSLGLVIGLDYKNPGARGANQLDLKAHETPPLLSRPTLKLNVSLTLHSGMLAAEAAWNAVHPAESESTDDAVSSSSIFSVADMSLYDLSLHKSWVHRDLYEDSTSSLDSLLTEPAGQHMPVEYPPFEASLSTDLLTSVALTGTNHAEDQPVHLRVVPTRTYIEKGKTNPAVGAGVGAVRIEALVEDDAAAEAEKVGKGEEGVKEELERRRRHVKINYGKYAGLLGRACPAGVYEYVAEEGVDPSETEGWGGHKLVINSQNCIHCKLCDVIVPTQDITWTAPEGGGGPKYSE
ncbi:hypothetical protein CVT25_014186 [Psilocybe cyanescens]|uniref:Electron transfer flavoprotein-ubiquinone oxidoreductase n=1 Tax=Psilocybe cyanescens TaxID=93625 RepID=A0A409XIB1_PSICY|nr:hypothetical protein CVT25_014186 [Psilocybe cyanescens]